MQLGGEEVNITSYGLEMEIFKEPYYSAGKTYGFKPTIAFGINFPILNYAQDYNIPIIVRNANRRYRINAQKALEFIEKYNAIEKHKTVNVGIVGAELWERI